MHTLSQHSPFVWLWIVYEKQRSSAPRVSSEPGQKTHALHTPGAPEQRP